MNVLLFLACWIAVSLLWTFSLVRGDRVMARAIKEDTVLFIGFFWAAPILAPPILVGLAARALVRRMDRWYEEREYHRAARLLLDERAAAPPHEGGPRVD